MGLPGLDGPSARSLYGPGRSRASSSGGRSGCPPRLAGRLGQALEERADAGGPGARPAGDEPVGQEQAAEEQDQADDERAGEQAGLGAHPGPEDGLEADAAEPDRVRDEADDRPAEHDDEPDDRDGDEQADAGPSPGRSPAPSSRPADRPARTAAARSGPAAALATRRRRAAHRWGWFGARRGPVIPGVVGGVVVARSIRTPVGRVVVGRIVVGIGLVVVRRGRAPGRGFLPTAQLVHEIVEQVSHRCAESSARCSDAPLSLPAPAAQRVQAGERLDGTAESAEDRIGELVGAHRGGPGGLEADPDRQHRRGVPRSCRVRGWARRRDLELKAAVILEDHPRRRPGEARPDVRGRWARRRPAERPEVAERDDARRRRRPRTGRPTSRRRGRTDGPCRRAAAGRGYGLRARGGTRPGRRGSKRHGRTSGAGQAPGAASGPGGGGAGAFASGPGGTAVAAGAGVPGRGGTAGRDLARVAEQSGRDRRAVLFGDLGGEDRAFGFEALALGFELEAQHLDPDVHVGRGQRGQLGLRWLIDRVTGLAGKEPEEPTAGLGLGAVAEHRFRVDRGHARHTLTGRDQGRAAGWAGLGARGQAGRAPWTSARGRSLVRHGRILARRSTAPHHPEVPGRRPLVPPRHSHSMVAGGLELMS